MPSPEPVELVELPLIRVLLASGALVVSAGGGGIPVVADASGALHGVEAVVDKDLTAALLARAVDADALLLLTDVDAVTDGFGTSDARPIRRATALRPSTPPESGEPLEDLTDGAARSRSIEEPGNDISGRQVWTELA